MSFFWHREIFPSDGGASLAPNPPSLIVYRLWASPSTQPEWPQLQDSSTVLLASLQYWLQYLLSFEASQLHAG